MNRRRNGRTDTLSLLNMFEDEKWVMDFKRRKWRRRSAITGTDNPKGKVGQVRTIPTFQRSFGKGKFKFELFSKNKKVFDDGMSFIKGLERRGFKIIGSGAFSTVLAKEGKDRVIKIIRRPDGWLDYVQWAAKEGEAGRFAPKVYSYKLIKGHKKEFGVAVMERLKDTFEKVPEDHALKILPDLMFRLENPMAKQFADILAPGITSFVEKMKENYKIKSADRFDLHYGNLMIRDNGQFVIVDPVSRAGMESAKLVKRLRAGDFSPAVAFSLILLIDLVTIRNARSNRH